VLRSRSALTLSKYVQDLIKQGGEPEVESVKRTGLANIPGATLQDYFELNAARSQAKTAFQQFWLQNRIDALLYPAGATTATPLDEWKCITYTALWNLLDYPALIIPTGKVCESDSADSIENASFGPEDKQNYSMCKSPSSTSSTRSVSETELTKNHRHWSRRLSRSTSNCTVGGHASRRRSTYGHCQSRRRGFECVTRSRHTLIWPSRPLHLSRQKAIERVSLHSSA
jgi:hypothetical protein